MAEVAADHHSESKIPEPLVASGGNSAGVAIVDTRTVSPAKHDYSSAPGKDIPEKDGMIYAHGAIRQDLVRLERTLPAVDVRQQWHLNNLALWTKEFCVRVHHHHDIEEKIFFPWLLTKASLPPKVAADHKALVSMMGDFEKLTVTLRDAPTVEQKTEVLARLRELFPRFNSCMREHLLEEEEICPHQTRMHFTLKEYEEMENRIVKSSTLNDLSWMGPWAFGSDPEGEAKLTSKLPGFLVFTYRKKWKPAYLRYNQLVESIYDPTVIPPHMQRAASACWCFA